MFFLFTSLLMGLLVVGALAERGLAAPYQEGTPAEAQDSSEDAPPPTESSAPEEEPSVADRTPAELSDAERLLRMQQVVALDEAKLEGLRTDLARRNEFLGARR